METPWSGPSLHFPSLLDPHSRNKAFWIQGAETGTRCLEWIWGAGGDISPQEPMGFSLCGPRGLLKRGLAEDTSMGMGVDIREKADLRDRFSGAHGGRFSPIEAESWSQGRAQELVSRLSTAGQGLVEVSLRGVVEEATLILQEALACPPHTTRHHLNSQAGKGYFLTFSLCITLLVLSFPGNCS